MVQAGSDSKQMTDDPALAELLTLWSRLPDEMRQSLLQSARTKAGLVEHAVEGHEEQRRTLATHENDIRTSSWTLIQNSDRTLHVEQRAQYPGEDEKVRTVSINEFMRGNGPPPRLLQTFIDRLFQEAEPVSGRGPSNTDPGYAHGLRAAAAALDMLNQTIRLHAGELTPDEMRCVQAVLGWKRREILARADA